METTTALKAVTAVACAGGTPVIVEKLPDYAKWLIDFKDKKVPELEMLKLKIQEYEMTIETLKEEE